MATPTFNLPTSGSDPKRATKEGLEENINQIIQYLDDARVAGDDRATEGFYNAGSWDASTGAFPTVRAQGGAVQNGDTFTVSVAGIVDGQDEFQAGQRIIALTDAPSSTTYAGNWERSNTITVLEPLTDRVNDLEDKASYQGVVNSLAGLQYAPRLDGAVYTVRAFFGGSEIGGGDFTYVSNRPKADHDGGIVIDPDRIAAWATTLGNDSIGTLFPKLATLYTAGSSGSGCWVRKTGSGAVIKVSPDWFGATDVAGYNNSVPIVQTLSLPTRFSLELERSYSCSSAISVPSTTGLRRIKGIAYATGAPAIAFTSDVTGIAFDIGDGNLQGVRIEDLTVSAGSAGVVFRCALSNSGTSNVRVIGGAGSYGFLSEGFGNTHVEMRVQGCDIGISALGQANNINEWVGGRVNSNRRGVQTLRQTIAVTFKGMTFEGNTECDFFLASARSIGIEDCYFGNSSTSSITMAIPSGGTVSKKACIVIAGNNADTLSSGGEGVSTRGVDIKNNYVFNKSASISHELDCFVWVISGRNLDVTGTTYFTTSVSDTKTVEVLCWDPAATFGNTVIGPNGDSAPEKQLWVTDISTSTVRRVAYSGIKAHGVDKENLLTSDAANWDTTGSTGAASFARRQSHDTAKIERLSGATFGSYCGVEIDLNASPHLRGQTVYIYGSCQGDGVTSVNAKAGGNASNRAVTATTWTDVDCHVTLPTSGTIFCGFVGSGGDTTGLLYVKNAFVGLVGAGVPKG